MSTEAVAGSDPARAQIQRLRRVKLVATGLLVAMAALYVVASVWLQRAPWLAYVRAFAEAATVGACADWFAVTALFRRPLGLPIPHTGIIPRNKERIGEALGNFIADNFLTQEILEAKLQKLEVGRWGAQWLRRPGNAAIAAERLANLAPELLDLSSPEARRLFAGAVTTDLIASIPAASLASNLLDNIWNGGQGEIILDAALDFAAGVLSQNEDLIRAEVAGRTYRWLPRWLDEKIADKLMAALSKTIDDMRRPDHPWRARTQVYVQTLINRLQTDETFALKAEQLKLRIASHPAVLMGAGDLLTALEFWLHPASPEAAQALVQRITGWLIGLGDWISTQEDTVEIFNAWARLAVQRTIAPRRFDIGRIIAAVVAGWDTRGVVEKLELQIGADLQYIRINGTIVGGLAGLTIFILSNLFGLHKAGG